MPRAHVDGSGFDYNGESNLDLQYAMSLVGKKQNVTLYQVGDTVEGASFNNLLDALDGSYCTFEGGDDPSQDGIYPDPEGGYQGKEDCGTVTPAKVISTSYSYDEYELTPAYMERQCAEYAKLGLMGVTMLYSSGDYGVGGYGDNCLTPDGDVSSSGKIFTPTFPGGCPYITSVGATQVNPGAKVTDPESACEQVIYSGGGFSNVFKMPSYQKSAVETFMTKYTPPYSTDLYNATGSRAYPDLSANGCVFILWIIVGPAKLTRAHVVQTTSSLSRVNSTSCTAPPHRRPSLPPSCLPSTTPALPLARSPSASSTLPCVQLSYHSPPPFLISPADLLEHVQACVQRHHERHEPRMRHGWFLRPAWLGPRHRRWHPQLPETACSLALASLSVYLRLVTCYPLALGGYPYISRGTSGPPLTLLLMCVTCTSGVQPRAVGGRCNRTFALTQAKLCCMRQFFSSLLVVDEERKKV